jgi:hypothetical protein
VRTRDDRSPVLKRLSWSAGNAKQYFPKNLESAPPRDQPVASTFTLLARSSPMFSILRLLCLTKIA